MVLPPVTNPLTQAPPVDRAQAFSESAKAKHPFLVGQRLDAISGGRRLICASRLVELETNGRGHFRPDDALAPVVWPALNYGTCSLDVEARDGPETVDVRTFDRNAQILSPRTRVASRLNAGAIDAVVMTGACHPATRIRPGLGAPPIADIDLLKEAA